MYLPPKPSRWHPYVCCQMWPHVCRACCGNRLVTMFRISSICSWDNQIILKRIPKMRFEGRFVHSRSNASRSRSRWCWPRTRMIGVRNNVVDIIGVSWRMAANHLPTFKHVFFALLWFCLIFFLREVSIHKLLRLVPNQVLPRLPSVALTVDRQPFHSEVLNLVDYLVGRNLGNRKNQGDITPYLDYVVVHKTCWKSNNKIPTNNRKHTQ
jgi:hypothetical protein